MKSSFVYEAGKINKEGSVAPTFYLGFSLNPSVKVFGGLKLFYLLISCDKCLPPSLLLMLTLICPADTCSSTHHSMIILIALQQLLRTCNYGN